MREGGARRRSSRPGPGSGANGPFDSLFAGASADGCARLLHDARARWPAPTPTVRMDVYERSGGNTSLVSTGPSGGNGPPGAELVGVSDDGTKVFFHTAESAGRRPTPTCVQDVYQRAGGVTTLLSVGPTGGNGTHVAVYDGNSQDGSKVFFRTAEALVASDTDAGIDVYERANAGDHHDPLDQPERRQQRRGRAVRRHLGGRVEGVHREPGEADRRARRPRQPERRLHELAAERSRRSRPVATTSSPPPPTSPAHPPTGAACSSAPRRRWRRATRTSTRTSTSSAAGSLTRALDRARTAATAPMHAFFGGSSQDGTQLFFETYESLVTSDTDANTDVYERYGGATEHLSAGVSGGNGAFDATFRAVSSDGQRVFIRTAESLLAADTRRRRGRLFRQRAGHGHGHPRLHPERPPGLQLHGLRPGRRLRVRPAQLRPHDLRPGRRRGRTLSNQKVFTGVTPGVGYSVTQAPSAGWDQTARHLRQRQLAQRDRRGPGQEVTCTFTNQKRGQILVVLDAQPNDAQDFGFTAGGGLSPASFSLDDDGDGTLPHIQNFTDVAPGSGYSVPSRSRAAGCRAAPRATTAAPCRTSTSVRARSSPAPSPT